MMATLTQLARSPGLRIISLATLAIVPVYAQEPPLLPVGLDAYRMWDHWADQRIGERSYMRSTYDRMGGQLPQRRIELSFSTQ
jgi:hypothetical protein